MGALVLTVAATVVALLAGIPSQPDQHLTLVLPQAIVHADAPRLTRIQPEPEPSIPRLHVLAGEGEANSESRLA